MTPTVHASGLALATRRRAIGPFSLDGEPGEVVGLTGPNGSGKTTCMRMLLGLDPTTSGVSRILGAPVDPRHPPRATGAVLEADGFYPWLTGARNLALFAGAHAVLRAPLPDLLVQVGLGEAADRPVRTYSRGMRVRLSLARALLGWPTVLVLDEPTVALDVTAIAWLSSVLDAHRRGGGTVVVASHDHGFLHDLDARNVAFVDGRTCP